MHLQRSSQSNKKTRSILTKLVLGASAFSFLCTSVHAAIITYSSAADFAAATNGDITYSFPATAGGNFQNVAPSYTDGPLTFGSTFLYLGNDGTYGAGQTYLAATVGTSAVGTENITLTGATALSFTLGSYYGASAVSVNVNGTAAGTFNTAAGFPTTTFFGVTSTAPISSLSFTYSTQASSNGAELDVIRFQVGNVNAVPEPSALALLGVSSGGAVVIALRRRRKV